MLKKYKTFFRVDIQLYQREWTICGQEYRKQSMLKLHQILLNIAEVITKI